jgi:DNA polymerase elongation subunit (family B)
MPLYGLDIETDTTVDGLDPSCAAVVAVGLATPDQDEVFLGDEADILARLDRRLAELDPGVVVTWNGGSFDLPFLAARARVTGTALDLELWPTRPTEHPGDGVQLWPPPQEGFGGRWGEHAHLDGYRTYRSDVRRSLGLSCGLKAMARLIGIEPVEVDYEQLHTLSEHDMAAYVASDARLACVLVERRLPAVLAAVDRPHGQIVTGARAPILALPHTAGD